MSVSQVSLNSNSTFHQLRELLHDNTMDDLSVSNSLVSFRASQHSHAFDITGLELHSRDVFDHIAKTVSTQIWMRILYEP